jgi:hypothetical protein
MAGAGTARSDFLVFAPVLLPVDDAWVLPHGSVRRDRSDGGVIDVIHGGKPVVVGIIQPGPSEYVAIAIGGTAHRQHLEPMIGLSKTSVRATGCQRDVRQSAPRGDHWVFQH